MRAGPCAASALAIAASAEAASADVAREGDAADRLRDRLGGSDVEVEHRDPRALRGERFRGRAPEPEPPPVTIAATPSIFMCVLLIKFAVVSADVGTARRRQSPFRGLAGHLISPASGEKRCVRNDASHSRTTCGFGSLAYSASTSALRLASSAR